MYIPTSKLLRTAKDKGFAVGAFNIYNLEGALAVVGAAEEFRSPVMLQLLPSALQIGSSPLIALCLELAESSSVPVSVHLDHCSDEKIIDFCLRAGLGSIMADGSPLPFNENIAFTRKVQEKTAKLGDRGFVEAELGKLNGEEDGISVAAREAQLTDPNQAIEFVRKTRIGALAVCIGNVHGRYYQPPDLDFDLLSRLAEKISLPLVLHGTSGLPDSMIEEAIGHGVCKFNVNTEVRSAYTGAIRELIEKSLANSSAVELVDLMQASISHMKEAVQSRLCVFNSADKAPLF